LARLVEEKAGAIPQVAVLGFESQELAERPQLVAGRFNQVLKPHGVNVVAILPYQLSVYLATAEEMMDSVF
jgi:hypothetical protein